MSQSDWEERVRTEYTFRKLVFDRAILAYHSPNRWNESMIEKGYALACLPERNQAQRIWQAIKTAKAYLPMWLALFICRDLREELELR